MIATEGRETQETIVSGVEDVLLGTADADIKVGMRVEVTCQQAGDVMVPYWKAAS